MATHVNIAFTKFKSCWYSQKLDLHSFVRIFLFFFFLVWLFALLCSLSHTQAFAVYLCRFSVKHLFYLNAMTTFVKLGKKNFQTVFLIMDPISFTLTLTGYGTFCRFFSLSLSVNVNGELKTHGYFVDVLHSVRHWMFKCKCDIRCRIEFIVLFPPLTWIVQVKTIYSST